MEIIIWLQKKTHEFEAYLKPATYVDLISTPLVGNVRHQIKRANFDGGCRVSKQECFILHSFQSVQFIKVP